jgi:tetratricopeptide repeat protein 8
MRWLPFQGSSLLCFFSVDPFCYDRPGTSLQSSSQGNSNRTPSGSFDPAVRPVSQSGRPLTGFARPLSSRPTTGSTTDVRTALQTGRRTATASGRPMTTLGREVRLGTASLSSSSSGALVDIDKLNVKKYAPRTGLAMTLTDYLLYVEHNTRKALSLCAEATKESDFKNWWWKARLGKCYMKLGQLSSFYPCFVLSFNS